MDPLPLESYPEFNAQTKSNDMLTLYTSVFLDIKQGMWATLKNMFPTVSPEALDVIFKHDRNLKIYYLKKNVLHIQNFFYIFSLKYFFLANIFNIRLFTKSDQGGGVVLNGQLILIYFLLPIITFTVHHGVEPEI